MQPQMLLGSCICIVAALTCNNMQMKFLSEKVATSSLFFMNRDYWIEYINLNIQDEEKRLIYYELLNRLIENSLPILLKFENFEFLFKIKKEILALIYKDSRKFYRTFTIPKRNGSLRFIQSPLPLLQYIQRYILDGILSKIITHNNAFGFVKHKSIVDNVKPHLNSHTLLKLDIDNFFPSIKIKRVISIFQRLGYSNRISFLLAKFCCYDDSLPQGAPTSPYLSNIIAKRLDSRLYNLAKEHHLKYSRYADDMTFSGNHISKNFIDFAYKILIDEGFTPNYTKSKLIVGRGRKIITGLSISNKKITIPRNKKRELRSKAYSVLSSDAKYKINYAAIDDPIFVERLIGQFSFWNFVEPDNLYAVNTLKLLKEYSSQLDNLIE